MHVALAHCSRSQGRVEGPHSGPRHGGTAEGAREHWDGMGWDGMWGVGGYGFGGYCEDRIRALDVIWRFKDYPTTKTHWFIFPSLMYHSIVPPLFDPHVIQEPSVRLHNQDSRTGATRLGELYSVLDPTLKVKY
jgi:hypothetical protein